MSLQIFFLIDIFKHRKRSHQLLFGCFFYKWDKIIKLNWFKNKNCILNRGVTPLVWPFWTPCYGFRTPLYINSGPLRKGYIRPLFIIILFYGVSVLDWGVSPSIWRFWTPCYGLRTTLYPNAAPPEKNLNPSHFIIIPFLFIRVSVLDWDVSPLIWRFWTPCYGFRTPLYPNSDPLRERLYQPLFSLTLLFIGVSMFIWVHSWTVDEFYAVP